MHLIGPGGGECFYIQTLLTVVQGPTSFEDLMSFEGHTYPTFKDACFARGLLEDDTEWKFCLRDAVTMQSGWAVRRLFATILLYCHPTDSATLWQEFKEGMCDDVQAYLRQVCGNPNLEVSDEEISEYGLWDLNCIL